MKTARTQAETYLFTGQMDDPMAPVKTVPVRIVERIIDKDHYVFEWHETHDGK